MVHIPTGDSVEVAKDHTSVSIACDLLYLEGTLIRDIEIIYLGY
jgi:hypothetical protein